MRCLTILLGNCFLLLVSLASCGKVSLAEEAVFSIPVDTTFMRLRQWEWYCQKRADSCLTENNYQGALSWLDSARIQVEHYGRPYYILARGDVYYSIHQYDSARRYFSMAAHSIHPHIAIEAWRKLAELELMEGNEKQVFYSTQKADALFRVEIGHVQSDNSEALYQEERLKNELNQLKIAKQNREIAMLTLSLCLIILIALFIFYRQNKIKCEKERLLLEEKAKLEQENQILKQTEELSALREKEAVLRESLFRKVDVLRKIPSLNEEEQESGEHRIALSEREWEEIRQTVDNAYDGFSQRLLARFPLLTLKDIYFCCLVKINVSIKDLSDIYCISRTSVSKKKFRIKREKLGAEDSDSLDDFLRGF